MTRFARRRGPAVRGRPADIDELDEAAAGPQDDEAASSAAVDAVAGVAGGTEDIPDRDG